MTSKKHTPEAPETPATSATENPGIVPESAGGTKPPSETTQTVPAAAAPSETVQAAPSATEVASNFGGETVAAAPIKVTLIGAVSGTYEGPAGKNLKEMFPALASETYQARHSGKMVKQTEPWMVSAEVKTVQHAKHG